MNSSGTAIIDLHDADSIWPFYLHDGQSALAVPVSDWQQLQAAIENQTPVHVVVPGEYVRTTEVKTPKNLSIQELRNSIPFMLEEEVLSDIEATMCLPIERTNEDKALVAIVNKSAMTGWIAKLSAYQIALKQLYPDYFALPYKEQSWVVYENGQRILVRMGKSQGLSLSKAEFKTVWPMILAQVPNKPERIISNFYFENTFEIPCEQTNIVFPDITQIPINLLQNEFKQPELEVQNSLQRWAGFTLAALMAITLTSHALQYHHWSTMNSTAQEQIQALYSQAYPNNTEPANPDRILSELKNVGGMDQNEHLIQLLNKTGQALANEPGSKLLELQFQDARLILTLQFPDFSNLDQYKSHLQKIGVNVKQEMATNDKDGIKAKLVTSWNK